MIDFFIRRPVFATVCSLLIVLAGAASIPLLPIAQYPELAPPQVTVTSRYTGASAQIVESAVTTPLEQAINGVEGMKYMTSTSGNDGTSQITVTFDVTRDQDLAAVDVQNRVSTALGRLPQEVQSTGVTVNKSSTAFVMVAALYSENGEYDNLFLSNYADVYMIDALKRIEGVSEVRNFGERKFAMRIWLDPERMASRNLTAADVVGALREQNAQIAAGEVGQTPAPEGQAFQISVRVQGRLADPDQFGNMILKTGSDGTLVQLKDVGRAEVGAESYSSAIRFNGYDGIALGVFQLPDANALDVFRNVDAELKRLATRFPPGMQYSVAFETTSVVSESISEVLRTLLEAIGLVIAVIFVFLQSWRSTLIPALTIPVSLVGTFAFVQLFGFSINTLTLFGLTLATGLVVDDAIVVIENIERHIREKGASPRQAASAAMAEVFGAVIAVAIVLTAVFVPVALFPGTTGRLYQQFALTIAFSVALSAFNAVTLTPALSALLLKHGQAPRRGPFAWFNRGFDAFTNAYRRSLHFVSGWKGVGVLAFVVTIAFTYWVYQRVPTGFVPDEDQGYFITQIQAPPGVSLEYTSNVAKQVEAVLRTEPDVLNIFTVLGFSFTGNAPNKAVLFSPLKPMAERTKPEQSAAAIIGRLRGPLGAIPEAIIVPFSPPPIRGIGNTGGFQFMVTDQGGNTPEALAGAAYAMMGQGNARPDLRGLFTTFSANDPQFLVTIDREKAKSLGVSLAEIGAALQVYMGSLYVNDFDFNNRSYRVYAQADREFRSQPKDIGHFYVRTGRGDILPLDNVVQIGETTTPQTITHYNLFRSVELNGAPAPGYSSGQAIAAMQQLAAQVLPQGMAYEWTGLTLEEIQAGGQAVILFGLGLLVVFLVLAAQYKSFALPFIILLSVPTAVLGAVGAQALRGLVNDVFAQIGLLMLIGLSAKNAVLIVEFAEQLRQQGAGAVEAAVEAAHLRLRPILMTSLAFILGLLPLVFASGAGSGSRISLGTAVVGGMLVSTVLNLYFTPLLYVVFQAVRGWLAGALGAGAARARAAEPGGSGA
jgi:hydrophobic/amphiphilic exporter-1 (mainly G- bacteria), HAE1 family